MDTERMAQLGTVEVPITALDGGGDRLQSFLDPRQVAVPPELANSGAPQSGWRVLPTPHDTGNQILLGAPVDDTQWLLGRLTQHADQWTFSVHGPVPRLPSREERGAGLELRWPHAATDAAVDQLFIDVVNTSSDRWAPTPVDDFYTVGMLVAAGNDTPTGYSYAYVRGQSQAFILDPDEYARVHVSLGPDTIIAADQGQHLVYAAVPALNLMSEHPLPVVITPIDLERATPPQPPRGRRSR